jgi:hypothetical protein
MKNTIQARILSASRRDCNSYYRQLWRERWKWSVEGERVKRRKRRITVRVALRMYFSGAITNKNLWIQLGEESRAAKAAKGLPERWPSE